MFRTGIILLLGLLMPWCAYALSLGDHKVNSLYSRPLEAEIAVPSATSAELDSLTVTLADDAHYEKAGVRKSSLLSSIKFSVKQKPDGTHYIALQSNRDVNILVMNLIIDAQWKSGRIIRGYDFLFEIPGYENRVLFPKNSQSVNADAGEVADGSTTSISPRLSKLGENGFRFGPIREGDTLSEIAHEVLPGPGMSPWQVMAAMYRENPNAFVLNNANNLVEGAYLEIKDVDTITAMSRNNAIRIIYKYSKNSLQHITQVEEDAGLLSSVNKPAGTYLVIEGADAEGENEAEILALESELSATRQVSTKIRTENKELEERLDDLMAQLEEINTVISDYQAKEKQVAEENAGLQDGVTEMHEPTQELEEVPADEVVAQMEEEVSAAKPMAIQAPKPVAVPEVEVSYGIMDFVDSALDDWKLPLGALILLVGTLVYLRFRKLDNRERLLFKMHSLRGRLKMKTPRKQPTIFED